MSRKENAILFFSPNRIFILKSCYYGKENTGKSKPQYILRWSLIRIPRRGGFTGLPVVALAAYIVSFPKYTVKMNVCFFHPHKTQGLAFNAPRTIIRADRTAEVRPALARADQWLGKGKWLAGFICYEAATGLEPHLQAHPPLEGLPLLLLGVYDSPEDSPPDMSPPANAADGPEWQPLLPRAQYDRALQKIRDYLRAGDSYQVNYTFPLQGNFNGDFEDYFRRLRRAQPGSYAAFIDTERWAVASVSPELFFRLKGKRIKTRPMKGTAPRGLFRADDLRRARQLAGSEKEQAENVMIVDMMRNDLSRFCRAGSVTTPRLFSIEQYPTVWQMTSEVEAETEASFSEIIRHLFPCASITGAPKVRTMEIIRELEPFPRGIYTGAVGYMGPKGVGCFNVAIRTVLLDKKNHVARYGVGGGIVWDSRVENEYRESLLKAGVLRHQRPPFRLLETLLYKQGPGWFLPEEHLQRLQSSRDYFGFNFPLEEIRERLYREAARLSGLPEDQRVRLLVDENGHCTLEAAPLDKPKSGQCLALAPAAIDRDSVWLYHKTDRRDIYDTLLRQNELGCNDVLLYNNARELTETTIANIVFEWRGEHYTPPQQCGLLGGVFRAFLLKEGRIKEKVLTLNMLPDVSRLWRINSVRGWMPVKSVRLNASEQIEFNVKDGV